MDSERITQDNNRYFLQLRCFVAKFARRRINTEAEAGTNALATHRWRETIGGLETFPRLVYDSPILQRVRDMSCHVQQMQPYLQQVRAG